MKFAMKVIWITCDSVTQAECAGSSGILSLSYTAAVATVGPQIEVSAGFAVSVFDVITQLGFGGFFSTCRLVDNTDAKSLFPAERGQFPKKKPTL